MKAKIILCFIVTIVTTVVGYIGGTEKWQPDNSVGNDVELSISEIENEITETIVEIGDSQKNEITDIAQEKNDSKENATNQTQKDVNNEKEKVIITQKDNSKKTTNVKEEIVTNKPTTVNNNNQTQVTTKNETKEIIQSQKEEYIYNVSATNKIISDINEIAKRNPELWGVNGEKLYKIEVSSSLLGKNYMSPYRKQNVEGIVLNVFPVKFLVYAVDYKCPGYTTQTRYYIDVANY